MDFALFVSKSSFTRWKICIVCRSFASFIHSTISCSFFPTTAAGFSCVLKSFTLNATNWFAGDLNKTEIRNFTKLSWNWLQNAPQPWSHFGWKWNFRTASATALEWIFHCTQMSASKFQRTTRIAAHKRTKYLWIRIYGLSLLRTSDSSRTWQLLIDRFKPSLALFEVVICINGKNHSEGAVRSRNSGIK